MGERSGALGFWVSKPGWDVRTAPPEGLQFSSEWAGVGFLTTGTIACNWSDHYNYRYFGLGKTFPSPPLAVLQDAEETTRRGNFSGYYGFGYDNPQTRLDGSIHQNYHYVYVTVQESAIRIKSTRANDSNWITVPDFTLRYFIFDYNL
jgi:hypothetical protein